LKKKTLFGVGGARLDARTHFWQGIHCIAFYLNMTERRKIGKVNVPPRKIEK
jgi:hypothetical protein